MTHTEFIIYPRVFDAILSDSPFKKVTQYRMLVFLSFLYVKRNSFKDSEVDSNDDDDRYIEIYSRFIRKIFGGDYKYKEYLEWLIERNIIECDNEYLHGEEIQSKCIGYRLSDDYVNEEPRGRYIDNKNVTNLIRKLRNTRNQNLKEKGNEYFELGLQNLPEIVLDSKIYQDIEALPKKKKNKYLSLIKFIENPDIGFLTVSKEGRFYNAFTNFPSSLRKYLTRRGERLVNVDISCCQPLMMSMLMHPSERNDYLSLVYNDIYIWFFNQYYKRSFDQIPEDRKKEFRDGIKIRSYKDIFFGGYKPTSKLWKIFKSRFPKTAKEFYLIKKDDYLQISSKFQKLESSIIIKTVVNQLIQENIFCLTIHDSVVTTVGNENYVKELIQKAFNDKIGVTPKINYEYFTED